MMMKGDEGTRDRKEPLIKAQVIPGKGEKQEQYF